MFDVALTQFVWDSLQVAGSEIAVVVWDKIKTAVSNAAFEKMQQYFTNQQEDEFKQQLENILDCNQPLAEQLEQLRQSTNNHNIITNNFSNITTQGDFIAGNNIVIK